MDDLTLRTALTGLAGGVLTYPVAQWLFREMGIWVKGDFSPQMKRLLSFVISFALALGAYGVSILFDYVEPNAEGIFASCLAAFATSQALHGWLGLPGRADGV